jgi:hypothetical protein
MKIWLVGLFSVTGIMGVATRMRAGDELVPLKVSICDLYASPAVHSGKMIEVRATIVGRKRSSLEPPSFARQETCSDYLSIALESPDDVKPKPPFELQIDAAFEAYRQAQQNGMRIEATLQGRFDPVFAWKDRKRVRVGAGEGFGDDRTADARLVLRKLSSVTVRPLPRK